MGWAPGAVFTFMNERFNDLRLAMFAVLGFHAVGLLLLLPVDVDKARAAARETEHLRHHTGGARGEGVELKGLKEDKERGAGSEWQERDPDAI